MPGPPSKGHMDRAPVRPSAGTDRDRGSCRGSGAGRSGRGRDAARGAAQTAWCTSSALGVTAGGSADSAGRGFVGRRRPRDAARTRPRRHDGGARRERVAHDAVEVAHGRERRPEPAADRRDCLDARLAAAALRRERLLERRGLRIELREERLLERQACELRAIRRCGLGDDLGLVEKDSIATGLRDAKGLRGMRDRGNPAGRAADRREARAGRVSRRVPRLRPLAHRAPRTCRASRRRWWISQRLPPKPRRAARFPLADGRWSRACTSPSPPSAGARTAIQPRPLRAGVCRRRTRFERRPVRPVERVRRASSSQAGPPRRRSRAHGPPRSPKPADAKRRFSG